MTQAQSRPANTPLAAQTPSRTAQAAHFVQASQAHSARTHAALTRRTQALQDIITAVHMHTVEASAAMLRRAWTLAGHGKVLTTVHEWDLGRTIMGLTHLREDDVTLAGFLVQDGEVRARSWTGMWADETRSERDADTLLQGAVKGGGPVTVVFCRLICTAMDPDLETERDWDVYAHGQAVDAFMAYHVALM